MKQFKGGLYANLGNYKSSLPQTKILNDFFKQNPVGYKKGGEVKGIKGVNYSRIPVTGGFMANAQGFQNGGSVSAFYGKRGQAIAPGRIESQGLGPLFVYEPGMFPTAVGSPAVDDPDFGKIMTRDQAKKAGFVFDAKGNPLNPFSNLREGDPGAGKSALTGVRFPIEETTPMEFSDAKDEFIATSAKRAKEERDAKKRDTVQKLMDEQQKNYEEASGITSILNNKTVNKSKTQKLKTIEDDVTKNIKSDFSTTPVKPELGEAKTFDSTEIDTDLMDKIKKEGGFEFKKGEDIFNEAFDKSNLDAIIANQKKVSEEAEEFINNIGKDFYEGEKEGDAPKWALPLMMAGLRMAASDNPSLLGAAAEGGIAGMEEYAKKQKELRQDAKDKIALDMQKASAIINLRQKGVDLQKDFAVLEADVRKDAFNLAFQDYQDTKKLVADTITKETEFAIGSKEHTDQMNLYYNQLDQQLKIKQGEIELEYQTILDNRDKYANDVEYKKALLEIEAIKIENDAIKHFNNMELNKVTEGKITTVVMKDTDGDFKEFKVRTYYDFDEGTYKTDTIGFAPFESGYLENLENEIRDGIAEGLYPELQDKSLEFIEAEIAKIVQQKINADYGNIQEEEPGAGG
jgi:hypothetical protein